MYDAFVVEKSDESWLSQNQASIPRRRALQGTSEEPAQERDYINQHGHHEEALVSENHRCTTYHHLIPAN
jgi:hypothetical protein